MRRAYLRSALERDDASQGARLVFLVIALHANGDGDAWPKVATIARLAGMSQRTVAYRLAELEKIGLVTVHRRLGRQHRYSVGTPAESAGGVIRDSAAPPAESAALVLQAKVSDQHLREREVVVEDRKEVRTLQPRDFLDAIGQQNVNREGVSKAREILRGTRL